MQVPFVTMLKKREKNTISKICGQPKHLENKNEFNVKKERKKRILIILSETFVAGNITECIWSGN